MGAAKIRVFADIEASPVLTSTKFVYVSCIIFRF